MQRILLFIALLILPFGLLASSNDDLTKSKGTGQEAIVSLLPQPEQENVSRYAKIEAAFSVPLDPSSVQPNNIKLTFLSSQTNDHIGGSIGYDDAEHKVSFTPNDQLEPGMYEVEIKSLKADKAYKATQIKEIKYRFIVVKELLQSITIIPDAIDVKEGTIVQLQATGHYDNGADKNLTTKVAWRVENNATASVDVNGTLTALREGSTTLKASLNNVDGNTSIVVYKEINGHRLPPEPDPAINNSTLLGIDSNHNDVRDDVERWIYETYKDKHPVHIDISMQAAKAFKKVLQTPEKAREIYHEVDKAVDCELYYSMDAKYLNEPILLTERVVDNYFINKIYFNTEERMDAYIQYDTLLSGYTYTLSSFEEEKKACDFNTSKYEE